MARVQLNCGCGWVFFVSDASASSVKCPSCSDDVRVPGGRKGPRVAASEIAREKTSQRNLIMLAGGAVVGAVVIIGGILLMTSSGGTSKGGGQKWDDLTGAKGGAGSGSGGSTGTQVGTGGKPPPPMFEYFPPPAEAPGAKIDWEQRMNRACHKLNVAGMTAELLRIRNQKDVADSLEEAMLRCWNELKDATDKLREERGGCVVPGHMLPGDRIMFFDGAALGQMSPKDKDKLLGGWLKNKLHAGATLQVSVRREDEDVGLLIYFNECSKELRMITKVAEVDIPDSAFGHVTPPPVTRKDKALIPPDVAKDAKEKLSALHPYYQLHFGDDKLRIDAMLAEGKADPSEIEWLNTRMGEVAITASDEQSSFRAQIAELEARMKEPTTSDTIVLKSGERKEGKIIRESEDEIELQIKVSGITGSRPIKKEDIREVLRGKGAATEFPGKLAAAKDPSSLAQLITWCKEKNLAVQKEVVCYTLLLKEPGHDQARREFGFQKQSSGLWSKDVEARRKGDRFEYGGKEFTVAEFLGYLRTRGYVEMAGQWYEKKDWGYRIDNLYGDSSKLRLQGDCAVGERIRWESRPIYDPATKSYKTVPVEIKAGRFVCPPPLAQNKGREGTATIVVEAPGELLECRVKALSELTAMGTVAVRVYTDSGQQKALYSISAPGRTDDYYDVSDVVRGVKVFYIEARMTASWQQNDNGVVMFLPSQVNSRSILDVRAKIASPLPKINELLRGVAGGTPNPNPNPNPNPTDVQQIRINIEALAETVLKESDIFKDAIINVRSATSGYKYPGTVEPQADYSIVTKHLSGDPTTFDPSALKADALLEIGGWWSKQTIAQKRAFARWWALYCAIYRNYK